MPATIVVTQEERPALAFALARCSAFYADGTAEQRDSAASLWEMLRGLDGTPEATVEMDFLTQDAHLLGIRLFYCEVELEQYWLDLVARSQGERTAGEPDPTLDSAVQHYFPDVVSSAANYAFDKTRGLFTDLGIKLNTAVSEAAPRARAIYNSDRAEMSDKAAEIRDHSEKIRSGALATESEEQNGAAVAVAETPPRQDFEWGVEVPTGLAPDDIPLNSFRPLTVGSVHLFVTNFGGNLAAVGASCPHQKTALLKGRLEGTVMECPRHGAQFDLRDGKQLCPPFCDQWMQRSGMGGRLLSALIPDKKGGDLPQYPLQIVQGEIVLRI